MYLLFLFISQQAASKINLISPSYLLVKRRKKHTNAYLQAALENAPWPFFFKSRWHQFKVGDKRGKETQTSQIKLTSSSLHKLVESGVCLEI